MLRIATLATVAAALVAAPASAASIHVNTSGKTADQVKSEVVAAAFHLCRAESRGSALQEQLLATCMKSTVQTALTSAPEPALRISAR
jgi:hypothetical protein